MRPPGGRCGASPKVLALTPLLMSLCVLVSSELTKKTPAAQSAITPSAVAPTAGRPRWPSIWAQQLQQQQQQQQQTTTTTTTTGRELTPAGPAYRTGAHEEGTASGGQRILFLHGQLSALRRQLELELELDRTRRRTEANQTTLERQAALVAGDARAPRPPPSIGAPCLSSSDCAAPALALAHCNLATFTCACLAQHVQLNATTCLAPALLGYECALDAQCQQRVPESRCQSGRCACRADKFVAYRKDKCLPAAKLNDYCLSDEQCRLADGHSFCKWKIPNVYGTCKCPPNYKMLDGPARCAPRLGDTCLSDHECQLATANSVCARPGFGPGSERQSVLMRASSSWFSSSASGAKCTCARGFSWSASQLECQQSSPPEPTDTRRQRPALDSHKYETVIAKEQEERAPRPFAALPAPLSQAPPPPPPPPPMPARDQVTNGNETQQRPESWSASELEIKFVPLDSSLASASLSSSSGASSSSSSSSSTSTTITTTSTTSTTKRPKSSPSAATTPSASTTTTTTTTTTTSTTRRPQHANETLAPGAKGAFRMSSLGKPCSSRHECQARDPFSDCLAGVCECLAPSARCSARATGCHADTFQCRNGQCISWYFVCDDFRNCDDGSDEEACDGGGARLAPELGSGSGPGQLELGSSCPLEAFKCHADGRCVSRAKVCNGKRECADGSDELGCGRAGAASDAPCPAHSFACRDGQCLPAYVFCNAVEDCADASDEDERVCGRRQQQQQDQAAHNDTRAEPPHGPEAAAPPGPGPGLGPASATRPASVAAQDGESPLVKTDRASIQRLMAALALTRRTPEKRGRVRAARLLGAPVSPTAAISNPAQAAAADECPRWAFTCRNGKCRSSAILCSGVDGCGDNSDEDRCEVCQCEAPPDRHIEKQEPKPKPKLQPQKQRRRARQEPPRTGAPSWHSHARPVY